MIARHLSVNREIELIKETVALNAICACIEWLRNHDLEDVAAQLEADMIESEGDALPR